MTCGQHLEKLLISKFLFAAWCCKRRKKWLLRVLGPPAVRRRQILNNLWPTVHVAAGVLFSIAISARQEQWRNVRFIAWPDVDFSDSTLYGGNLLGALIFDGRGVFLILRERWVGQILAGKLTSDVGLGSTLHCSERKLPSFQLSSFSNSRENRW